MGVWRSPDDEGGSDPGEALLLGGLGMLLGDSLFPDAGGGGGGGRPGGNPCNTDGWVCSRANGGANGLMNMTLPRPGGMPALPARASRPGGRRES